MATAIHIEIDALFLLILCVIAWQMTNSVSKQSTRILFRHTVYGIMATLILDIIWMLIDGKMFPGAIPLNKVVNALFLGLGVSMGGIWYQYVLDSLGYNIPQKKARLIMIPGTVFFLLNFISIWTGWIFTITDKNVYMRGPWFPALAVASIIMLLISLVHLLYELSRPGLSPERKKSIFKLLNFYIVPLIGTIFSMAVAGMPGTWTCAAVSVILIYMNDQDDAILRDSLTGLNNRKTVESTFASYKRQVTDTKKLYLFIMDLDNFKGINDTFGHPVGDRALVDAAHLIVASDSGPNSLVARYGGDEFIVLGFFKDEADAIRYKKMLKQEFADWNKTHNTPYDLSLSIGFSCYEQDQTLEEMLSEADKNLYEDKRTGNVYPKKR